MAYSKVELFEKDLQKAAELFKSLAHPARLSILRYLARQNVCITGDITGELPLGRTTVNQHLAELKRTGLIRGTIEGSRTNYCLNPERMEELNCLLSGFLEEINSTCNKKC